MGRRRRRNKNKKKKQKEKAVAGCNKTTHVPVNQVQFLTKDDDWEVKLDVVKECGKISDNGASIVWIEPLAKVKIDALMGEYKSQEWLAYLLGNKEDMTVKDIFIPEQAATSVRVDDIECEEFNNMPVIGVIHSHHGMGTGFSGTDNTYINQNHDISLVVAHTGIAGQVRSKVPCGALMITDAKIKLKLNIDDFDKEKFLEKAKANIKKPSYSYQYNKPVQQTWNKSLQEKGKAGESGYWFMGEWHEADPILEDKEIEDEIQRIHGSTPASYWECKSCNTQNYTMTSTICWSCNVDFTKPQAGAWMCRECKGINNLINAASCIYCKTQRRPLTQAEKNQLQIEKEWGTKVTKHTGNYMCGRCNGNWANVDLRKFTECPNCDITLEDELKKDLGAEKKSTNADTVKKDTTTTSAGSNVVGSVPQNKNPWHCRICEKHVSVANSIHMSCMAKEKSEKKVNDTVWQTEASDPVV